MRKLLSDKMSPKKSSYHFYSEIVKALIRKRGGWAVIAAQLQTSVRTVERTVSNQSRNGRLQRDLLAVLRRKPDAVGYFATEHSNAERDGQQAA